MNEQQQSDIESSDEKVKLRSQLEQLPKIELHRHLEGSVRLETLIDIAEDHSVEMPEYDVETLRPFVQMMPEEHRSFQNFLAKFSTIRQFFLTEAIIRRITREVIEDAALDNVKYMELRFTPRALISLIKCPVQDVVTWVCEATEQAQNDFDIQVQLIVSMNRHESHEIGHQALLAALDHRNQGVVAVDLAGREDEFPASLFRDVFRQALHENLHVTIHAGEWGGAQSVWDAVGNLGAERIGHGIRALEDPSVVDILVQKGIVLEVCPTSNFHSGVIDELSAHPFRTLQQSGILITLNTDDPLISDLTLTDELFNAMVHLQLSFDDIKATTIRAVESAFLPVDERVALVEKFKNWLY